MHRTIEPQHGTQRCQQSNHECNAHGRPVATIIEVEQGSSGVISRSENQERDNDRENTNNVDKEDDAFNEG